MTRRRARRRQVLPSGRRSDARGDGAPRERRGLLASLFRVPVGPSPMPGIATSLGRGFVTVAASPVLFGASVGLVLAMWLGLVALGLQGPPGRMVAFLAIPPVSTYFDSLNAVSLYGFPAGLPASIPFLVVRALVTALLTAAIVESLEGGGVGADALRRGIRALPAVLAAHALGFAAMFASSVVLPALGPGFSFLGSILVLVAVLYFLAYVPVAAVREARGPTEALRRAVRAARIPGGGQLTLSMLYIFLSLPLMVALAPGGSRITVNPGLATWVYVLLANLSHVAFMAAFAYRWMAVEDEIPTTAGRR